MHLRMVVAIIMSVLSLCSCVALDSRAWNEPALKESPLCISGRYRNSASYRSENLGLSAASHFSSLTGRNRIGANDADTFLLSFNDAEGITVEFQKTGEKGSVGTTFISKDGLNVGDDGKIVLFSSADCGVRDNPGYGCMSMTITIFINPDGDLVAVQSGSSGGFIGIIPIGVYRKMVSIFPRIN